MCRGNLKLQERNILKIDNLRNQWDFRFFDDHDSFKLSINAEIEKSSTYPMHFIEAFQRDENKIKMGAAYLIG